MSSTVSLLQAYFLLQLLYLSTDFFFFLLSGEIREMKKTKNDSLKYSVDEVQITFKLSFSRALQKNTFSWLYMEFLFLVDNLENKLNMTHSSTTQKWLLTFWCCFLPVFLLCVFLFYIADCIYITTSLFYITVKHKCISKKLIFIIIVVTCILSYIYIYMFIHFWFFCNYVLIAVMDWMFMPPTPIHIVKP